MDPDMDKNNMELSLYNTRLNLLSDDHQQDMKAR